MQYVCQTCRFLKTRFSEHYRRTKKPREIDNFLYRHFKQTNHSTSSISIQPVEKIIYGDNSTKRYRNILRHELELKWIKLLQTPLLWYWYHIPYTDVGVWYVNELILSHFKTKW